MALKSGRKLGLTASLIAIIIPVIEVIAVVLLILSIIAAIPTGGQPTTLGFSLFSFGFIIIVLIALGIIGFIGFILFIIAMYRLAQYYNESGIFKNALYGFLINIIGTIVLVAISLVLTVTSIGLFPSVSTSLAAAPLISQFIITFLVILSVAIVLGIVSAVLYMRAFNKLAEKSGVGNFGTAGLLYLIGTVLTIVGIGVLLLWIAWIFAALGFYSLKPSSSSTFAYSAPQTTAPSITQKRYCPYCGIENTADAIYCVSCGKKLQ